MRYNSRTTCNSISVGLRSTAPKEPALAPSATPTKGSSTGYSTTRISLRSSGRTSASPKQARLSATGNSPNEISPPLVWVAVTDVRRKAERLIVSSRASVSFAMRTSSPGTPCSLLLTRNSALVQLDSMCDGEATP